MRMRNNVATASCHGNIFCHGIPCESLGHGRVFVMGRWFPWVNSLLSHDIDISFWGKECHERAMRCSKRLSNEKDGTAHDHGIHIGSQWVFFGLGKHWKIFIRTYLFDVFPHCERRKWKLLLLTVRRMSTCPWNVNASRSGVSWRS